MMPSSKRRDQRGRCVLETLTIAVVYAGLARLGQTVAIPPGNVTPIYPPARPSQIEEHLKRQASILRNAQAALLIADKSTSTVARLLRLQVESLRDVVTVDELTQGLESEILEVAADSTRALFPGAEPPERDAALADVLATAFAKLDPVALGLAAGIVCGVGLFLATVILLLYSGDVVGPRLALLGHFHVLHNFG